MPLNEVIEELRTLPGEPIDPPIHVPAFVLDGVQKRLLDLPPKTNAALFKLAATEAGGNAVLAVKTESGWELKAWVGTQSWHDPKLTWGVELEKTWTW